LIILLIKIKITHLLIVYNAASQKTNYQQGTQGLTMPNVLIHRYISIYIMLKYQDVVELFHLWT